MEWVYAMGGVIGGLLIGIWIGRIVSPAKQLGEELRQTKGELDDYRGKVTQHFARTAELVEILAADSREIYRHLASGSQELCHSDAVQLKDTVLKPLPDAESETVVASAGSEVKPAAQEEPTVPSSDGEGRKDQSGVSEPLVATDESQTEEAASDSQWSEILPEVEARKEPARFH